MRPVIVFVSSVRTACAVACRASRWVAGAAVAVAGVALFAAPTQTAIANGDTRSLSLRHMHTGETIDITFKRGGRYDAEALKKLNWFLRDWRRDEPTRMDPRLFDIVWSVYREVGARDRVHVVSAYRSLATNNMLRRRSRGVAKFSQHTAGKAMDFYIPGVASSSIRVAGLRLQRGGVGFYPTANTPFVHLDAGNVRMWPKMTRQQLARVFPDGKTVHIPSDGKPMPGYAAAYAEVMRGGGSVRGVRGGGDGEDAPAPSLFAQLFGGGDDEGDADYVRMAPGTEDNAILSALSGGRPAPAEETQVAAREEPAPRRRTATSSAIVVGSGDQAEAPAAAEAPARAAERAPAPEAAPAVEAPVVANVPMPVRKPAEIAALQAANGEKEDATAVTADVPVPPARPDAPAETMVAEAIQPPTKPTPLDETPAEQLVALLEPARPVGAAASGPALGFAAENNAPLVTAGTAAPSPGLPPARPQLVATPAESLDFVQAATPNPVSRDKGKARLVKPDLAASLKLIEQPRRIVTMRFGLTAYGDLRTDRFSGPAIKPLRLSAFEARPNRLASIE